MQRDDENLVLFPKWEMVLKEESLQAIQEKRYEDALNKIDELLRYNVLDHEVIVGRLMCLMELGRYQEAEDMCEEVIRDKEDEYYFHYVHLYITILFQSNKFDLVTERIEEELESDKLPTVLREQFLQLHALSDKMESDIVEKKTSIYIQDLLEAVARTQHQKQWQLISTLRTLKIVPDENIIGLLKKEEVHPVNKTGIFIWLKELDYKNKVIVQKFGQSLDVIPKETPEMESSLIYLKTMQYINEVEHQNPTLYQFLTQLFTRYLYVQYPLLTSDEDAEVIARSLTVIGQQMMGDFQDDSFQPDATILEYIEQIINWEQLYLSIIEE
ncbi:tetratricopeptide repeat protein [Ornithinibacillus scapharcae]|uniref:tetratricopeptide repeat protein n=1 Tax=Ornithinibacillus scapharcae TaxID=1147159 RepID=UPI000225BF68|nr:tetratricopeptide repeat protein [Ornithinibacillus scapharcae]